MVGKYSVYMNGIELQSLDDAILLTDVVESEPQVNNSIINKADGGTILLRSNRTSLSVQVSFAIRDYDAERRKDICCLVYAWARQGYLEISDRPGQRLKVRCIAPPVLKTGIALTDSFSLMLTAYEFPYWESNYESKAYSKVSKSPVALLAILGERDALLSCRINVNAGTLRTLNIITPKSTIKLEGLSIASGNTIDVAYTDKGYMTIKQGENSLYSLLLPESDDVLRVGAGTSKITMEANTEVSAIFTARGVFE